LANLRPGPNNSQCVEGGASLCWRCRQNGFLRSSPMRKIALSQILVFVLLFSLALALAVATDRALLGGLPLGDFRGVVLSLCGVFLLYVYAILIYRACLAAFPLRPGEIGGG